MALPTYAEVADRLGVTICRGIRPQGGYCPLSKADHQRGIAELSSAGVTVHWSDRRASYSGFRDFAMLVAGTSSGMYDGSNGQVPWPAWKRLFHQLRLAKSLLITARLRPKADIWAEYMAHLHAMAIAAPRSPERDRAVRWSQGH